ncbi:hypothetical protein V493_08010 [Pseudogymnoascus sp. VKM F-4281 (FW-2241)]|nr:hypothetical protein V493_08010 [Pseudogymnoascus sp. VKM F-4281 (FW-2241)]
MKLLALVAPALVAATAIPASAPAPSKTIKERATEICGQWDSIETGTYTLYQGLWGIDSATSGSQCSTYESLTGDTIAWSTNWTWQGGEYNVKSYANIVLTQDTGHQVSAIKSIPSKWAYTYTGTGVVANVAYDVFSSATAEGNSDGSSDYEIMIWLATIGGAGPISDTGASIASVTIAGQDWDVWYGLNGSMKVFSFVAPTQVDNFDGDLKEFYTYLVENQDFSDTQYITSIGAGTEPFVGTDAVMVTSGYSIALNV